MSRPRVLLLAVAVAVAAALLAPAAASAQTRLLRFPDVHGDRVVFTYAGDLWMASTDGGAAWRLTSHPGVELFARFSPDGGSIAFTGQYDGDEQVYVMPAAGGVPRQLTYYPARGPLPPRWGWDHIVYGWTPDGSGVLFRSLREGWDIGDGRLYTVSPEGGLPVALPMPTAGAGDFSPDGGRIVYSPLARDFRSWKRYAGGWAQDLYTYELASGATQRVTEHPRSDRDPMWIGERIWFTSDRTGTLNLFAFDPAGGELEQVTRSTTWDVRWPSAGPDGRIVYELGGQLHVLDTASGEARALDVSVPADLLAARPRQLAVADQIQGIALSPAGRRALVVARGDVFTLAAEEGPARKLTHSSGAHDKHARWSPDGRRVAYVSDASGEDQLWLVAQDGSGEPRRVTDGFRGFLYAPEWSPDGERIALADEDGKVYVVTVADGRVVEIADDPQGQVGDYTWSPDARWLAFSLAEDTGFRSVWVWGAADGQLHRVTDAGFNEYSPSWGAGGEYLYFLADRQFAPQIGSFEWNYAVDKETYVYALALRRDVAHPFPPKSDEVELAGEEGDEDAEEESDEENGGDGEEEDDGEDDAGDDGNGNGAGGVLPAFAIDFDGLGQRLARVPVEADNYAGIVALDGRLLLARGTAFYYGRDSGEEPVLVSFDLEEREEEELVRGFDGLAISPDGAKMLVQKGGGLTLRGTKPEDEAKPVPTGGLTTWIEPQQEWAQIFDEVWRRFRDFFYVENMHGYDWEGLRERYRPLLAHVAHRSDLNYLISEMISELSVSHAYIAGGDYEIPPRPPVALPGASFELDPAAGRYRIAEILRGDNAEPKYRAPLTAVGVDVRPGAYVLAIDGEELAAGDNPYRLLRFKADRPVTLTVNDRPSLDGAREVTYEPVTSEDDLRYLEMVDERRRRVEELSGGRVGYLHLPDMGASGIYEWIKWFYPQIRKQGLVVDVRGNGGGNVSQMLIERLQRTLLAVGWARTADVPYTYPGTVFHGPMAAILNETSASDGDIFPAMFKQAGLGPLIGKRSWGGVTGITNHGPLLDGGSVFVPEFGFVSAEGEWVVEGYGVDPDIVVENDPASVLAGRDPQLERAVQEVLDRLETVPHTLPDRPAAPVKVE
jgi:tricorn protease